MVHLFCLVALVRSAEVDKLLLNCQTPFHVQITCTSRSITCTIRGDRSPSVLALYHKEDLHEFDFLLLSVVPVSSPSLYPRFQLQYERHVHPAHIPILLVTT